MLLLPILILPRDADSVELRAPLVTPIFDFHLVISDHITDSELVASENQLLLRDSFAKLVCVLFIEAELG